METFERLSWKKKIKYIQISILIWIIALYFTWNFFNQQKKYFDNIKDQYQQKEIQLQKLMEEKNKIEITTERIKSILKDKIRFIEAYNSCYTKYTYKKYSISGDNIEISLWNCIYNEWFDKWFIKALEDKEIEFIAKWLGVAELWNSKELYPEKKVLYSLDKNIFQDKMENKVEMLSFGLPTLVNKNLNLYEVNFTFKTTVNYVWLQNILKAIQNKMYNTGYIYYSIKSLSRFDITQPERAQPLLVQWAFYFTK